LGVWPRSRCSAVEPAKPLRLLGAMVRQNNPKKEARVAALRAESTGDGIVAGGATGSAPLELRPDASDADEKVIARVLRAKRPDLGEDAGGEAGAPYLASSLLAYASERHPGTAAAWQRVLAEVLADAGAVLDDEDNDDAIRWVVEELSRKRVLVRPEPKIEEGALVLALLVEDDEWHEAVVQARLGDALFRVVFLEYGKPQETVAANIRLMDLVVDDGAEDTVQEGKCEMCGQERLLTFHHLIPKDVHPTYLKKRLPPGINGEPTRGFLNTYGTMICKHCHSFVHRLAPNDVLAREYNTLEKILEHPSVQRWVAWAGHQHRGIY